MNSLSYRLGLRARDWKTKLGVFTQSGLASGYLISWLVRGRGVVTGYSLALDLIHEKEIY